MKISVLNVQQENKGKYNVLEVSYKDLDSGKVTSKKLFSFGSQAETFKTLQDTQVGTVYTVTTEKNKDGYWDWIKAEKGAKEEVKNNSTVGSVSPVKNTYETAEERANRQLLIVRQHNLTLAVDYLKHLKKTFDLGEVITVAKSFEEYVFGSSKPAVKVDKVIEDIHSLPNDPPFN